MFGVYPSEIAMTKSYVNLISSATIQGNQEGQQMKSKVLHLLAKLFGLAVKIDGEPIGVRHPASFSGAGQSDR